MNLFIPIILIVISIGVFFTFIDPEYQEIKDLQKTKDSYVKKVEDASKIRKKRNELAEIVASLERDGHLDRLNILLPDHINNIELIVDIDRIAKENSIRIMDIALSNFSGENQKNQKNQGSINIGSIKKYQSTDLSFSFTTKYDNFKNFINDIRKSLRLLDIVSVELDKAGIEEESDILDNFNFRITVRAYWLSDK